MTEASKEGVIIHDEDSFLEFINAFANIQPTEPFRVRLVEAVPDHARVCAISIAERHWIAGPSVCRAVASVIEENLELKAIYAGGNQVYSPDAAGLVQALRDAADRLEIKRLN